MILILQRIPPAFIPKFHGKLIEESTLKCPNDEVWPVKMKHDAGSLFFDNGWQDFVKDKSLEVGDFLVFRYDGDSGFDVQIFGKSGCEKLGSLLHNKVQKRHKFISVCQCRYTYRPVVSAKESGEFLQFFSLIITLLCLCSNIILIAFHMI